MMTSIQSFYSCYSICLAVVVLLVAVGWVPISCETTKTDCTGQESLCQHGGTCQPNGLRFYCNCSAGWTGGFCSVPILRNCASTPCSNNGNCTNVTLGSGTTTMPPTMMTTTTTTTMTTPTAVTTNASSNSTTGPTTAAATTATRTTVTTPAPPQNMTFNCSCPAGFLGTDCAIKDSCSSSPCLNGASCINNLTANVFQCLCANGYRGLTCDQKCPNGWGGLNCTMWVGCALNAALCVNGGTCGDNKNCSCTANYTGDFCEYYATCNDAATCQHGGVCERNEAAKTQTCRCSASIYYGTLCESVNCTQVACHSNEKCREDASVDVGYTCACIAGFISNGTVCVQDPCSSNPCLHGGECAPILSKINSPFNCTCTSNYSGLNCAERACANAADCSNNGDCDSSNKKCICKDEYTGNMCEIRRGSTEAPIKPEYIWAPILAAVVLVLICLLVFLIMTAKTKRAQQGTYSPSRQEQQGSRVEIGLVLKPPPEERLI